MLVLIAALLFAMLVFAVILNGKGKATPQELARSDNARWVAKPLGKGNRR